MRVIGTAGHVDHGKSALVEALTGTHPDRLEEERRRQMTIDLGFAWMSLPSTDSNSGEEVGIVDVPGHRDFIENMLAGIGGIDAALFVIAADEGVMPQTREHLAILDLLQIPAGVIVLTKIDLVVEKDLGGDEWLELVEMDIRQLLKGTALEGADIIRTSAKTGAGIPRVKSAIADCLADLPPKPDLNRPRLPVDRVFSMAGFGTVVTGTLSDGHLRSGDEIEFLPGGLQSRIRGLQTHKQEEESAVPGSRTAVNISGVSVEQIQRGDVLTHRGSYQPSRRLDLLLRMLPDASIPIKHNSEVKFFTGASEVIARVRLLGTEQIVPGMEGWVQVELRQPVTVVRGDRFIIRRPSPGETLGGGRVLDPHPKGRHKRFAGGSLERLEALTAGTPQDILFQTIQTQGALSIQDLVDISGIGEEEVEEIANSLVESGSCVNLSPISAETNFNKHTILSSQSLYGQFSGDIRNILGGFHQNHPLKKGVSREQLKSQLSKRSQYPSAYFNKLVDKLAAEGLISETGIYIHLPDHHIQFTETQKDHIKQLQVQFASNPNSPPSVKESQALVGEDVYRALVDSGELVQVSPEVVFLEEDYRNWVSKVKEFIETNGTITVAQARDLFHTSRKYVLALLEYLDGIGLTVREGDARRLR